MSSESFQAHSNRLLLLVMQSSSGFHKLPAETIENILRLCAVGGHPFTIAAVAQTCRLLRVLVYDAGDRHLWHTLFLVLFDNPKSATSYTEGKSLMNALQHLSTHCSQYPYRADYDWRNECTERLWAQAYIHRHARPLQVKKKPNLRSNGGTLVHVDELHDDGQEHSEAHIRVLRALLSVITTAAPLVPQRNAVSVQEGARSEHTALTQLHVETPLSPPSLVESEDHLSLNMTWLKETLSHGLPFSLTKLLSEYHGRDWRVLPEGQDLCHLTGYLGFIPIPIVGTDETPAHIARAGGNNELSSGLRFRARRTTATGFLDMRETLQRQRAKLSARHLAFYITYLSRRRNWGPYLPSPPIIIKFQNVRLVEEDDDDEDMDSDSESDGDYHPPDDSNHTSSSVTPEPHGEDPQRRDAAPLPDHLYPDWTWLAAARIIAECKLRAHVDPADIARLEDWDNLRSGAWVPSLSSEPMDDDTDAWRSSERKSQTQGGNAESEEWRKYERDWAGVEGTWRLVCAEWLLVLFSMTSMTY